MNRLSSSLTLLFKLVFFGKGTLLFVIAITAFVFKEFVIAAIFFCVCVILMLIAKSVKSIQVDQDFIYEKGFFFKSQYGKDTFKKVGYVIGGIYFLRLNSRKKIYFLGTSKDVINSFSDLSDMGKKGIEQNIRS